MSGRAPAQSADPLQSWINETSYSLYFIWRKKYNYVLILEGYFIDFIFSFHFPDDIVILTLLFWHVYFGVWWLWGQVWGMTGLRWLGWEFSDWNFQWHTLSCAQTLSSHWWKIAVFKPWVNFTIFNWLQRVLSSLVFESVVVGILPSHLPYLISIPPLR